VDGYVNVKNASCTFCDEICQPPEIDSSIGFFDGFDGKSVGIYYGIFIGLSILW
jgi:hypothetical protein